MSRHCFSGDSEAVAHEDEAGPQSGLFISVTFAAGDAVQPIRQRTPLNVIIWRVDSPGVGL